MQKGDYVWEMQLDDKFHSHCNNCIQEITFHLQGKVTDPKSPHPLTVASAMYEAICKKLESQCCVIAGETCSGKTEIGRIVLSGLLKLLKTEKPDIQYKITMVSFFLCPFTR